MPVFLAILKALASIPALFEMFDQFSAWYVQLRLSMMKKENADAITKAVLAQDQRPIENAYGDPKAGEPSGIPGTVIVDAPPIGMPNKSGN